MDDLKKIRGIGQALERKLVANGVDSFARLAGLTDDEKAKLDKVLGMRGGVDWKEFQAQAAEFVAAAATSEDEKSDSSNPSPNTEDTGNSSQSDGGKGAGDPAGSPPTKDAEGAMQPDQGGRKPQPEGRVVSVTARKSRRRAGRAFGPEAVDIPLADLSADERKAIENDPQLSVKFID